MNPRLETALRDFALAYGRDPQADPRPFIASVAEDEREELAALIEVFLSRSPRPAWDAEAYERSSIRAVVEGVEAEQAAASQDWRAVLPALRDRARLTRAALVHELAKGLGLSAQEQKVGDAYHEMEQGRLDPDGVSDRVLDTLGALLSESAQTLREAGRALPGAAGSLGAASTFARTARLDPRYVEIADADADAEPAGAASPGRPAPASPGTEDPASSAPGEVEEWDEVDELFRGAAPDRGEARPPE